MPLWFLVCAVFFWASSVAASPCRAEAEDHDPPPPPEYHVEIERALSESAAGRWEEARVAFRRAHEIFPNARTLRGIGMVAFELRDYVDAYRSWQRALAEPCRALTTEQIEQVKALLENARGLLAIYDTSHLSAEARFTVDGRHTERELDGTLLLSLGAHELVVEWERKRKHALLHIRGGESGVLPIVLEEPPPTAPLAPRIPETDSSTATTAPRGSPPALAATQPTGLRSRAKQRKTAAIALLISGAATALSGLGVLVAGQAQRRKVEGAKPGTAWSDVDDAYHGANRLTAIGGGLMGLGAVTASVGGGLLLFPGTTRIDHGFALNLRGTF